VPFVFFKNQANEPVTWDDTVSMIEVDSTVMQIDSNSSLFKVFFLLVKIKNLLDRIEATS
jgi:hypothetical protein